MFVAHPAVDLANRTLALSSAGSGWTTTNWIALSSVLASGTLAIVGIVISSQVARFNRNRVRLEDRQVARENLRQWFAGLSESAPKSVWKAHRALDSRIREDIAPYDREALELFMKWAQDMHDAAYAFERSNRGASDAAHHQRMVVKWLFRDALALWVVQPKKGLQAMHHLIAEGYPYIENREVDVATYRGRNTRPPGFRLEIPRKRFLGLTRRVNQ